MKLNYYNHYIGQGNVVACFNALTNSYLLLKENIYTELLNQSDLDLFKNEYPNQYEVLYANGFIVEDDFNEIEYYKNLYYDRKYSRNHYHIIVNPTLDCNLGCWYCYESHQAKSEINNDIRERLLLHINKKYELDKFKSLGLAFFGGEPMLKNKIVENLINKIRDFTINKEVKLSLNFTTNATILHKNFLENIKDLPVSFQITLDGNREMHNKIRNFKNSKQIIDTYNIILRNIKLIQDTLTIYNISIRINFTQETLVNLNQVINDLDFCDRKHITINLHKVWQTSDKEIDKSSIFEFINYAKKHNFIVHYMDVYPQLFACYADNYNEVVINYNGEVFKCTARDFAQEDSEGKLEKNGDIIWKTDKWLNRINLKLPKICEECNLLPACGGLCSQNQLEAGENVACKLDADFTKEDYIIHNLNRQVLTKKIYAL